MCLVDDNNEPMSRLSNEKEKKNNAFTDQSRMYMFISSQEFENTVSRVQFSGALSLVLKEPLMKCLSRQKRRYKKERNQLIYLDSLVCFL